MRDEYVGTALEAELDVLVRRWLATEWPWETVRFIGRDLSWSQWLALPEQ